MSEPARVKPDLTAEIPKRIVAATFQSSIPLDEMTSATVKNALAAGVGNVDVIDLAISPSGTAIGVELLATRINNNAPGRPTVTKRCFVPWANVKGLLYG